MDWLSYILYRIEPVKRSLFTQLTASEVSLLAGITMYTFTEKERAMWLNPLRDMPEHEEWIHKQLRERHVVTLVGQDLPLLLSRINDPLTYASFHRGHEKIELWISVLHRDASQQWYTENCTDQTHRPIIINKTERVITVEDQRWNSSIRSPKPLVNMILTPPIGLAAAGHELYGADWHHSAQCNASGLEILFFKEDRPPSSPSATCIWSGSESGTQLTRLGDASPGNLKEGQTKADNGYYRAQTFYLTLSTMTGASIKACGVPKLPKWRWSVLRLALDIPYVVVANGSPTLVVPVSFQSTNMITVLTTSQPETQAKE